MATPQEIVERWRLRKAREAAAARAKTLYANDNGPDGYIEVDGEPMPFWLPPPAPTAEADETRIAL